MIEKSTSGKDFVFTYTLEVKAYARSTHLQTVPVDQQIKIIVSEQSQKSIIP